MPSFKGTHPAEFTESVRSGRLGLSLISRHDLFPADDPKRIPLDEHRPIARLRAVGAVALAASGREIDIRFKLNLAAVAAAFVWSLSRANG